MRVEERYFFAGGEEYFSALGSPLLAEVDEAIHRSDVYGKTPTRHAHNLACETLATLGWRLRLRISLGTGHSAATRAVDAVKNRVATEISFGHYTRMLYPALSLFPLLSHKNLIDAGILVLPTKALSRDLSGSMSMGHFEQIRAELEARGASNLDIPLVVVGIST